jgi:hypothetical protein
MAIALRRNLGAVIEGINAGVPLGDRRNLLLQSRFK